MGRIFFSFVGMYRLIQVLEVRVLGIANVFRETQVSGMPVFRLRQGWPYNKIGTAAYKELIR
jgi:hypothetical protein